MGEKSVLPRSNAQVTNDANIIQQEWFETFRRTWKRGSGRHNVNYNLHRLIMSHVTSSRESKPGRSAQNRSTLTEEWLMQNLSSSSWGAALVTTHTAEGGRGVLGEESSAAGLLGGYVAACRPRVWEGNSTAPARGTAEQMEGGGLGRGAAGSGTPHPMPRENREKLCIGPALQSLTKLYSCDPNILLTRGILKA